MTLGQAGWYSARDCSATISHPFECCFCSPFPGTEKTETVTMIRERTFRVIGIAAFLVATALGAMRPGHQIALAQSPTARFEPASCPFTLGSGITEGTDVRC